MRAGLSTHQFPKEQLPYLVGTSDLEGETPLTGPPAPMRIITSTASATWPSSMVGLGCPVVLCLQGQSREMYQEPW